jgi:hypothetical protein
MLSKAELNLFTPKVNVINAHLDSICGKDEPCPQCRESEEDAHEHILINNHRRVITDTCTSLRHCSTIREFRLQRTGRTIESWPTIAQEDNYDNVDDVAPSACPTRLLRPCGIVNMSTSSQHSTHQEARQHAAMVAAEIPEEDATTPDISQQSGSSFNTPVARSNTVSPSSTPPLLDRRVVEIVEEDDSIVDVTPGPDHTSSTVTPSEGPKSPSILIGFTNRLRRMRGMINENQTSPPPGTSEFKPLSATSSSKRHRQQELHDDSSDSNDSASFERLPPLPSTAAVNSCVEHALPPPSSSSSSNTNNNSSSDTNDDSSSDTNDDSSSSSSSSSSSKSKGSRKQSVRKSKKSKKKSKKDRSKRKKKKSTMSKNRKHFKKVTKLTSDLTKTDFRFHLKTLRLDTNPRIRRDTFLTFKSTVEDALAQHADTAEIMAKHPTLPDAIP